MVSSGETLYCSRWMHGGRIADGEEDACRVCVGCDDAFLLRYAPGCLKLRFLCLSHCTGVTGASVGVLLRGLPRLEEVCVVHCRGVGDVSGGGCGQWGLGGSSWGDGGGDCGMRSSSLSRLNMSSCLRLCGVGGLLGASSMASLDALRVLNLGRCRLVKNVDALQVARLPNLRWLDVSYTSITDIGMVRDSDPLTL